MVEHRTLTPLVLVRIQLPQPKFQNLPTGASFLLFSNIFTEFESLVLKNRNFLTFSNFYGTILRADKEKNHVPFYQIIIC